MEKGAEGHIAKVGRELSEQSRKHFVSRCEAKYLFAYRFPATGKREKGKCECTCEVCVDGKMPHRQVHMEVHHHLLLKVQCRPISGTALRFITLK
jgi:hypothetical protein